MTVYEAREASPLAGSRSVSGARRDTVAVDASSDARGVRGVAHSGSAFLVVCRILNSEVRRFGERTLNSRQRLKVAAIMGLGSQFHSDSQNWMAKVCALGAYLLMNHPVELALGGNKQLPNESF